MRTLGRLALLFSLPALLLTTVTVAAWLALGAGQTGFGPMRLTPLPSPPEAAPVADDSPSPTQVERLSPLQAKVRNALLPFSRSGAGVTVLYRGPAELATSSLECMTQAIYYEAAREPEIGKRAVAQVVVNRAASAPFPGTICGVVQQGAPRPGCQFTFECDGSLARRPDPALWAEARRVAEAALRGETEPLVGGATHYHADYVFPTWAPTMTKVAKIGVHIFYRWRATSLRTGTAANLVSEQAVAAASVPADTSAVIPAPPELTRQEAGGPADRMMSDAAAGNGSSPPAEQHAIASPDQTVGVTPVTPQPRAPTRPAEGRDHPRRAIPERPLGSSPFA